MGKLKVDQRITSNDDQLWWILTDEKENVIGSIAQAQAKYLELTGVMPDTLIMNDQDYESLVSWSRENGYINHVVSDPEEGDKQKVILRMDVVIGNILPRHVGVYCSSLGDEDE